MGTRPSPKTIQPCGQTYNYKKYYHNVLELFEDRETQRIGGTESGRGTIDEARSFKTWDKRKKAKKRRTQGQCGGRTP